MIIVQRPPGIVHARTGNRRRHRVGPGEIGIAQVFSAHRGKDGVIVVCPRDRGFAEGQRIPKIKKPKPIETGPPIKVELSAGPRDPAKPQHGE